MFLWKENLLHALCASTCFHKDFFIQPEQRFTYSEHQTMC